MTPLQPECSDHVLLYSQLGQRSVHHALLGFDLSTTFKNTCTKEKVEPWSRMTASPNLHQGALRCTADSDPEGPAQGLGKAHPGTSVKRRCKSSTSRWVCVPVKVSSGKQPDFPSSGRSCKRRCFREELRGKKLGALCKLSDRMLTIFLWPSLTLNIKWMPCKKRLTF